MSGNRSVVRIVVSFGVLVRELSGLNDAKCIKCGYRVALGIVGPGLSITQYLSARLLLKIISP